MKRAGTVVVGIICISLVVGSYYYVSQKNTRAEEDQAEVTEVQKIVLKDLSGKSYPATPREVIKFYNRILCCYYNEEYTDEEFHKLADQARCLLDEELLDNNPAEQYYLSLQADIDNYHENGWTISNASVCGTNEIRYDKVNGAECAYVSSSYFVREEKNFTKSIQNYMLRKDEEGKWKILAFALDEGDTTGNE